MNSLSRSGGPKPSGRLENMLFEGSDQPLDAATGTLFLTLIAPLSSSWKDRTHHVHVNGKSIINSWFLGSTVAQW